MGPIDKLIRFFQDDFKLGVEVISRHPAIYIDPNKFNLEKLQRDKNNGNIVAYTSQITEQIEAQRPGLSSAFSLKELQQLTLDSLKKGPFAQFPSDRSDGVCIINQPLNNLLDERNIYRTFKFESSFNLSQFRPFPANAATLKKLVGEHEGEHCNQQPIQSEDPEAIAKRLIHETFSDRQAMSTLRAEGRHDVIEAWKAIRTLAAAAGDTEHATSIFIDRDSFKEATLEHVDAAKRFREEMCLTVAAHLKISEESAEILRKADPQNFARTLKDALDEGLYPATRAKSETDTEKLVAKRLGIAHEQLLNFTIDRVAEAKAIYDDLKANGTLIWKGNPNPHIMSYMNEYIRATKILFVEDTSIPVFEANKEQDQPEVSSDFATILAQQKDNLKKINDELLAAAAEKQKTAVLSRAVQIALGLSQKEADLLRENDADEFYAAAEKVIKSGAIKLQTTTKLDFLMATPKIAKKLGIDEGDLDKTPSFLKTMAYQNLLNDGELDTYEDNPYMKAKLEGLIRDYKQSKLDIQSAGTALVKPIPIPPISGTPQVNLRGEENLLMRIGGLKAADYFALKADPVLAMQQMLESQYLPTLGSAPKASQPPKVTN